MNLRQLIETLGDKLDNPSGAAAGKILTTAGMGALSWSSAARTVNAQKLVIDGREYAVRTGTEGAEGFLTLGANTIWLDDKTVTLDLGGKQITGIFAAGTQVYSAAGGYYRVFDEGYVDGITWRGNYLPRPQYTNYGEGDLSHIADTPGYLLMYISGVGSQWTHNAHVMTAAPVNVPARAATMHIYCRGGNNNTIATQFGLLPVNAPNSYSVANGGVLSAATNVSGTSWRELTLALPDEVKGTTHLYPIINARGTADIQRQLLVSRVWFD